MNKLSKTEELMFLRRENIRLQNLVTQLMENGTTHSFFNYFREVKEISKIEFDTSFYIGLITITFNRNFVWFQQQDQQLDYIQKAIFKAFKGSSNDYRIVFSIEHHKDGALHAHMLIQHKVKDCFSITNVGNYRYELGLYFTDKVDSRLAVRLDEVSDKRATDDGIKGLEGVMKYIWKEKYKLFVN